MGSLNNSGITVKECTGHSGLKSQSANISWGMRFEECLPRLFILTSHNRPNQLLNSMLYPTQIPWVKILCLLYLHYCRFVCGVMVAMLNGKNNNLSLHWEINFITRYCANSANRNRIIIIAIQHGRRVIWVETKNNVANHI